MITRLRTHLTSNVVAYLALFVALSGTAYAVALPAGSVGTLQLKRDAVVSSRVANGSLLKADFRSGQLPGATKTALVTTSESTSSATATDLTTVGPSVTVTVPANGYIMYASQAEISGTVGSVDCQMVVTSATAFDGAWQGGMFSGDTAATTGYADLKTVEPGTHTFKLQYQQLGGVGECTFANRRLWITTMVPTP